MLYAAEAVAVEAADSTRRHEVEAPLRRVHDEGIDRLGSPASATALAGVASSRTKAPPDSHSPSSGMPSFAAGSSKLPSLIRVTLEGGPGSGGARVKV
jgi:hypothetical protein